MNELRIVFMGTPDFAVETLQALYEHRYTIAAVLTAPDKPAGRGRKLQESAVKKYAISKNIKVLQPTNLKDEAFITALRALRANLQIVVAFRMLPRVVWQMPEYGTVNLHASLLPQYRGAAPINWAIINGEQKTGVTTFFIDDKIDTGHIILREEVAISATETAGQLHDKLMVTGAELVLKTVDLIKNGNATAIPQNPAKVLKPAPRLHNDNCRIDWNAGVDAIYNFIRGLSPYPGARTLLENGQETIPVKIYSTDKAKTVHAYKTGQVLHNKKQLKVAVKDGFIYVSEMQLPGKRKMNTTEVLNGFTISPDAEMR